MKIQGVIFCLWLAAHAAGAETVVRVLGLHQKSENEALELIGGRLAHVRSSPASPPLADDAAFLLAQVLHRDGFADATVEWRIPNRQTIQLVVREGARLSLGQVRVTGLPKQEANKLARLYAKPAEKGRPLGFSAPPFREEDVSAGLSYIRQDLNANGYWQAEAEVSSRTLDPKTGAVQLTIDVRRGPLHLIGQPTKSSVNDAGSIVKLMDSTVKPFVKKVAKTANLNAMRLAVEEKIIGEGFPAAKIRMTQSLEGGYFIPAFTIDLGSRVRLRRILLEGLQRTNPQRIMGRLKGMAGDWYDESAMNKRLHQLLATGAFSSVRLETAEVGGKGVDATLHFEEGRAREVSVAGGFGTFEGLICQLNYRDHNLFGYLLDFNFGLEMSSRGLYGEVRITDPWLWNTDVMTSARLFALTHTWQGYTTFETGIDHKFTWKFGEHYKVELYGGYSVVNLSEDGLPSGELGETAYTNPRIRVTPTMDFRNSPTLPKRGWHLETPLEIGSAMGDSTTPYLKAGVAGGWYHEINRRYEMGIGGEFAMVVPGGDGTDLPIDLRVFNGGARSVRSFPEREMGTRIHGYPTGGEAMWAATAEITRTIAGSLKAVAFFDAGSIARNYQDLASSPIELAPGLGLRFDLPIGPVRLEYGYNLTRDPGEPAGAVHFAIGSAF